jgi:type III secretion system HrpE/YscL family protein
MVTKIVKKTEFEKKRGLDKEVREVERHRALDIGEESGVIDKKTLEARNKAETIIAEAEAEAAAIRQRAQRVLNEVEAVREKARKDGFAAGESKGLSQVTEKLVKIEAIKEKFYKEAEKDVIKLVTAIAEKVIGKIVEERPEVIRDVVRQALERSIGDRITVRINPDDYKALVKENVEFRDVLDRTKRLHFKEDDTIAKGGCVVETEVGTIDAQIETQIDAIKKALEI